MSQLQKAEIHEVGPRDGLQRLASFIPTERKVRLIEDLIDAGCRHIEVASFVSPKVTPQMSDGREVLARLPRRPGVSYSAFVPNLHGLAPALEASVGRISIGTAASEAFQQKNMNASISESVERIREIVAGCAGQPVHIHGYVSCVVECPYSGPVEPSKVAELADRLFQMGCHDIFLGETLGKSTVSSISRLLDAVLDRIQPAQLGIHLHDTYGQAVAGLTRCLERGIYKIDSSVAGLGGCPFAPGAAGNVATEDVLYLLNGMGIAPDINMEQVAAAGNTFCEEFGLRNDSKAGCALSAKSS